MISWDILKTFRDFNAINENFSIIMTPINEINEIFILFVEIISDFHLKRYQKWLIRGQIVEYENKNNVSSLWLHIKSRSNRLLARNIRAQHYCGTDSGSKDSDSQWTACQSVLRPETQSSEGHNWIDLYF